MIKKIFKIIGVIILLIILAAIPLIVILIREPGLYLRLVSDRINEDQIVEAYYDYDYDDNSRDKTTPFYFFTPTESGTYTFKAFDLESNSELYITLSVMDKYLNEYFMADNLGHNTEEEGTVSGSTALQASQTCYVLFTAEPMDEKLSKFSGKFKVVITKDADEEEPPQLSEDEPVTVKVGAGGRACAVFYPPETGYYIFEHSIVSRDSSKGYSSLSSITSSDKKEVGITSDISMLEKDKEYYVWVTANETNSRKSKIELSCRPLRTEKASGICSVDIAEESMIEYTAEKDCDLAVYTMSEGDPKLVIYETDGVPLRTDDKSEASLSENPGDIATVLRVKKGTKLRICIFGDVSGCRAFITEYTGDGTSLTMDDLVPVPENPEADSADTGKTDADKEEP